MINSEFRALQAAVMAMPMAQTLKHATDRFALTWTGGIDPLLTPTPSP